MPSLRTEVEGHLRAGSHRSGQRKERGTMYTSFFGNLENIPAELRPVGIARGVPKFYKGESDRRLAPTWAMLKMAKPDYDRYFAAILAKLDPQEIYQSLGENAVLL